MRTTTRKILAYSINLTVPNHEIKGTDDPLFEIFKHLKKCLEESTPDKRLIYNKQGADSDTFICNLIEENSITGKILRLRSDLWPQVMNMTTAELTDLVIPDNNEVVESSHFQIRKEKHGYKILFEYNHYGAKINHFVDLLILAGKSLYSIVTPVVLAIQIEYDELINEITDISELSVEIKKNNIKRIEEGNVQDSLIAASKVFDTPIIHLKWSLEPSVLAEVKSFLGNIFNKKTNNPYNRIKIYSKKQGKRLQWFDLMERRTSFQVKPLLRSKRVLDSTDMFRKIKEIEL